MKRIVIIISCLLLFIGILLFDGRPPVLTNYIHFKNALFSEKLKDNTVKMSELSLQVFIPSTREFNVGLTSPSSSLLLELMGKPGMLTKNCSPILNRNILKLLVFKNIGPFWVTGIKPAVETLDRIFSQVLKEKPEVYREVKSLGMLCCRKVRGKEVYSNHSWGVAIDLMFGNQPNTIGDEKAQLGLLEIVDYFNAEGFYWGGGFEGKRQDPMHFEASTELLEKWEKQGLLS